MRKVALGIATLLTVPLAAACGGGADSPNGGPDGTPPATQGSQHSLGSTEAPVLLVEYADFQ